MIDLSTKYLGLKLNNPLVISASPLSKKIDNVKKLEEAGASAVVVYSLFEEQLTIESQTFDYFLTRGSESFAEAITYFPDLENFKIGPEKYINHIKDLKASVDIPIIGSLNGISTGGWINISKEIEQAGADALELNLYYVPTELDLVSQSIEDANIQIISDIKNNINIPLSVKLSPFYTSLPNVISKMEKAGADGFVLFNRFYQPDLDVDNFEVVPNLDLSTSKDILLPLRWVALLFGNSNADFALTSGVHNGIDMVKSIMAGASVCMSASEILKEGAPRIPGMLQELSTWMQNNDYTSIGQMKGAMSQKSVNQKDAYERANYIKALSTYEKHLSF